MFPLNDSRAKRWLRRRLIPLAVDGTAWAAGLTAAVLTRYELEMDGRRAGGLAAAVAVAVLLQIAVGHARHLYRGRYPIASFEEVRAVTGSVAVAAKHQQTDDNQPARRPVPLSAPPVSAMVALVLMLAVRYV